APAGGGGGGGGGRSSPLSKRTSPAPGGERGGVAWPSLPAMLMDVPMAGPGGLKTEPPAFTLTRPPALTSTGAARTPMTPPAIKVALPLDEMFNGAALPSRMDPPVELTVTEAPGADRRPRVIVPGAV